jgi:GT2 family glycosyltransferase
VGTLKTASIIIPTYNHLELLQTCIASIRKYTEIAYEIIVVDNASTDGTADWCRQERLILVSLPRNEGVSVAYNKGLRFSSGDTLVLLNNDTVVTPNWLSNMSAALYSSSEVGIVGPVTHFANGSQLLNEPFEDWAEFQKISSEMNVQDRSQWKRVERIVGICFVFSRNLMEKIGLLNKCLSPGEFEGDDFCMRTRLKGYRLLVCHDTLIYRQTSQASSTDHEENIFYQA